MLGEDGAHARSHLRCLAGSGRQRSADRRTCLLVVFDGRHGIAACLHEYRVLQRDEPGPARQRLERAKGPQLIPRRIGKDDAPRAVQSPAGKRVNGPAQGWPQGFGEGFATAECPGVDSDLEALRCSGAQELLHQRTSCTWRVSVPTADHERRTGSRRVEVDRIEQGERHTWGPRIAVSGQPANDQVEAPGEVVQADGFGSRAREPQDGRPPQGT